MADETLSVSAGELAARVGTAPALAAGTVLAGRYRIEKLVAHGGMGSVYEATDQELGIRIALKTIRSDVAWAPDAIDALKRELQLARAVTHPCVCRTFDLGRHGDATAPLVFLTMELLDGQSLAAVIRERGRIPVAEALPIALDIAHALGAAHAAGIVHRDLKPANVMLARRGARTRAVVTDFGLARETAAAEDGAGTPGYMAPEQRAGGTAGPAADVFALGVVLCELVSGVRPRDAAEVPADLPSPWTHTIERCLAADPAQRFAAVDDVAAALSPPPRRRRAIAIGAAVVAIAIAAAVIVLTRPGRAADPARPTVETAARAYDEGVARLRAGDEARAIESLRAAVAADPAFPLAHAELAAALTATGARDAARQEARAAEARSGQLPRALAAIVEARGHEAFERWDRAIEVYQELARIEPAEREHRLRLAYAQIAGGKLREAQATVAELKAGPPHPRVDMIEAYLASRTGDWRALIASAERAVAKADELGARRIAALAWDEQGIAKLNLGELDGAAKALDEAERRFTATGDQSGIARVMFHRAQVVAARDGNPAARELAAKALALYTQLDHRDGMAMTQVAMAMYAPPDALDDAIAHYDAAAALYRKGNDPAGLTNVLLNEASVYYKLGDHGRFRTTLDEVLRTARTLGDSSTVAAAAINLGLVTLGEADPPRAQLLLEEAEGAARALGDPAYVAYVDWGLGEVARARGDVDAAVKRFDAVLALADTSSDPSPIEQARCAKARVEPSGDVASACTQAAAALEKLGSIDDAVVLSWQVVRSRLATRDQKGAASALAHLAELAAGSHDKHTQLIARIAAAEVAGTAAAITDLEDIAKEAKAMGAHELALEAQFGAGRLLRATGEEANGDLQLATVEEAASARGMVALARRSAAARRR